ncbi:unnamed protein product [Schistocephalus solidus]|uniref:PAX3-and PAX7-binding protein 1 n=1 Tax=Schistocephalus solidus TaxID=70667 RepID=A0A183TAG7_SCHSO|nr:unnamed protein product [Schistocephalus solidus]
MEPFEYDDYSEFDTEELDFELPPRKSTFRSSRHASPFELEIDDQEIERLRSRVRQVTSDFLDSCDSTRNKAKKKDEAALKQIDMAMELPPAVPKSVNGGRRRRSLGMPPRSVLEEIDALESFGRDTRDSQERSKRSECRPETYEKLELITCCLSHGF